MPSVGMRRSTRVFGARVLRSGRRLFTEPYEVRKFTRAATKENDWIEILNNNATGGGGDRGEIRKDVWKENETAMEIDAEPKVEHVLEGVADAKEVDRMCGIVYRRKRKREVSKTISLPENKKSEKRYVRGQWRKKRRANENLETRGYVMKCRELGVAAIRPSYESGYWIACFLACVLNYMRRVKINLRRFSKFVHTKPILDAYFSRGVLFLQDFVPIKNPGICIISGSKSFIPVFAVNFSAIPYCFVHMHLCISLRSAQLDYTLFVHSFSIIDKKDNEVVEMIDSADADEPLFQLSSGIYNSDHMTVSSDLDVPSQSVIGLSKSPLKNIQFRNSRIIRKRSSLRRKRGRPQTFFRPQKANGSKIFRVTLGNSQSPASLPLPTRVLRSSGKKCPPSTHIKEQKHTTWVSTQDINAPLDTCSANLLFIESEKCYRENGAVISLELSTSRKWFLAVTKDGTKRCNLTAQKFMNPYSFNRFTHSIVWAGDSGLKLEFPNKQDWLIFKYLYKECSDRNIQASAAASVIPVPRVQEVDLPFDINYVPYVRPNSYITVKGDELSRALVKRTANYDMDSDDEDWVKKYNDGLCLGRDLHELLTPDSFELSVDALEKGFHTNPNMDEKDAYDCCMHLERKEVVEAIFKYWVEKRRKKHSALVRIFKLYQPRRSEVIPISVLRKKRSFKRQASQAGNGKKRTFLPVMIAAQDPSERQNNLLKVQEAKSAANKSEELAVLKRQKAQILMENADLLTYKATMALRIAEAAEISKSLSNFASLFLG